MYKNYIYYRCSTDGQDYAQQQECVKRYMNRHGIGQNDIASIVMEKVSGTVKHEERRLFDLLNICENDDTILVSELSRLGRNMSDLFAIVSKSCEKGISIIQCKDGTQIENNSIGGKALLFALSLAAEIEVANIRQRTLMGLEARKEALKLHGEFTSKSGRTCTHLGREKGCDLSRANAASSLAKQLRAESWRKNSVGYQTVRRWIREGRSKEFIIHEFNENHKADPGNFSTPNGGELNIGNLNKWIREIKNEII